MKLASSVVQMAEIPATARELLESNRLAHIVTLNPDGSRQMSCVCVGVEDGDISVVGPLGRPRTRGPSEHSEIRVLPPVTAIASPASA
jgi:hypothetical protein